MSIIINKYPAKQIKEGAGVIVNRVFGYHETKDFDPFLMLDYFDEPDTTDSPGFPWHPHKGMETISYFIRGKGEHQDSLGNKGVISEGELQWMSAGKGIMHQEMPVSSKDGAQGFQFWVNLPADEKLKDPEYQYIEKGKMKTVEEKGALVRVISGKYKNVEGVIDKKDRGITMLHITLEANSEIELKRAQGKQGFIFVFEGDGYIDQEEVSDYMAYTLNDGTFKVKSSDCKLHFIFAEGIPLKEPIAWYGPVVMNTKQELADTFKDIEEGHFPKDKEAE